MYIYCKNIVRDYSDMSIYSSLIKIIRYLFSPFKKMLALYLIGVLLLSFLEIFRISLVYPIVNYGLDVESQTKFLDDFFDWILGLVNIPFSPFPVSCLLLLITSCVIVVIYGLVAYGGAYLFSTVRDNIDRRVFARINSRPYSYFASKKQGDLLYIGQGAVVETGSAVMQIVEAFKNLFMAFLYLIFLFMISFDLTVAVIILGAVYAFVVKKQLFSRVYRNSSLLTASLRQKSVVYQEFISGIKTIFITGSVAAWKDKYDSAVTVLFKAYLNVTALNRIPSMANDFIMFSIIACGGVLLYLITGGDFLPYVGTFGVFMLGLYRMVPTLTQAQSNITSIIQYLPSMELVYQTLTEEDSPADISEKSAVKKFSFNDRIEFSNVSFRYNDTLENTIRSLSFSVKKNTRVAIVGSSGSGKTTTANLLALLYKPTSGTISVDETDLQEIDPADYLRAIGYIGQETFVYHDTIKENIKFGLDVSDDDVIRAAKLADADGFIMETPDGYDTIIGDQGIKLSGGQRQRVAIARIILRKPQILLLDEATSSLDNISEKKIMESIEKLSENMTVITIAHRLSTIQNADVIYVMKHGEIAEFGSHDELMAKKGVYYSLYLSQGSTSDTDSE